jgi:hypothetical protein
MSTRKEQRRERLCFAIPAGVFLLFAALETLDAVGFEIGPADTLMSIAQLSSCETPQRALCDRLALNAAPTHGKGSVKFLRNRL